MKIGNIFSTKLSFFIFIVIISSFLASCDDSGGTSSYKSLTSQEISELSNSLPGVVKYENFDISQTALDAESEVLNGSGEIHALYDDSNNLLGWSRLVNTGVGCHDNQCSAVKFVLVFDNNLEFADLYHPADSNIGRFFKGIENNTTDSELFTTDDWSTLITLMTSPPTKLLEVTDRFDMVDAKTGATYETYWDVVVRQAAYTTYTCLEYLIHTKEIIQSEILNEE